MTSQLPNLPCDELTSCSRKRLPVYGSCNVTSTTYTLSGPFRRVQHFYRTCTETKAHDSAASSAICSSRDFYLTTTRWLCTILEATRFSSTPTSDGGRSHRSSWSFFAATNARLWLAQRASSRAPSNRNVFPEGEPLNSIEPSYTKPTINIVHDVR